MTFFAGTTGMILPKLFCTSMICEYSGIFMNWRNIMGKDSWKGSLAMANNVMFLVTYTLFRVVLFPMIIYSTWQSGYLYDFNSCSLLHKFGYWFILIVFTLVYFLNLYWYKFVLRGLKSVLYPNSNKKVE